MNDNIHFPEFDKFGRYIEDSCYGCYMFSCDNCPRNNS